jgi:hypothetical protein
MRAVALLFFALGCGGEAPEQSQEALTNHLKGQVTVGSVVNQRTRNERLRVFSALTVVEHLKALQRMPPAKAFVPKSNENNHNLPAKTVEVPIRTLEMRFLCAEVTEDGSHANEAQGILDSLGESCP